MGGVLITGVRIELPSSVTLQEAPGAPHGTISCGNSGLGGEGESWKGLSDCQLLVLSQATPHSPSGLFPRVQVGWEMGIKSEGVWGE